MDTPTREDVRKRSRLLRGRYDDVEPPDDGDDLGTEIVAAAAIVGGITGRMIAPAEGEEVPSGLVEIALQAVSIKAEQIDVGGDADTAEEIASGQKLRSITAGPWSEQYFAPSELIVRGGVPQLDPDARLATLLWLLCTDEKREEYLALFMGHDVPAVAVTNVDYRRAGGGYGLDGRRVPGGFNGWW